MANLELVDNLARAYRYSHEEVLALELEFTYSLLWLQIEQQAEKGRFETIHKLMNK